VIVVMDAHVAEVVAVGAADVLGDPAVEPASGAAGRRNGRLHVRMHQAAAENALAVAHLGDRPRQPPVAHRAAQPRHRGHRIDGTKGLRHRGLLRAALPLYVVRRRLKLVLVHMASISPPRRDRKLFTDSRSSTTLGRR
jgi:hypothetical protein